ncbi:MAG: cardiolipin synthase [Candidatus Cryptobacteroides sp.]
MPLWLEIFIEIAAVSNIVFVIIENKRPAHALAWMLIITFIPVLGLLMFFFFGMEHNQERLISSDRLNVLKSHTLENYSEYVTKPSEAYRNIATMLHTTNTSYPLSSNKITPYFTFSSMSADMLRDIENAKDHIHFQFFKFENDEMGRRFADALVRKAKEGVSVRVQYDDAANYFRKRFFRRMKKEGVEIQSFIKIYLPLISAQANLRNHRKVVVIDGKIGYLGGMNIAQRYDTGLKWGCWRDTHCRIEGPAVSELQTSFLVDWQFSSRHFLDSGRFYPKMENLPAPGSDSIVQILTSGPMDEWKVIMQGLVRIISQATRYVYIQSPYFIPTEAVSLALKNAALSGVDVRLIIPYRGDRGSLTAEASKSYIEEIMAAGVKVFFYNKGFMHSKAVVADDTFCTIGSTNMDIRSFELDFEINAFIYDSSLAVRMRQVFEKDLEDSTLIDYDRWRSRPRIKKFRESFSRLFSPLL